MSKRIAVVGDTDSIYGFAALGLGVFPCDDAAEASHKVKELAKSDYGVIYITEALYEQIPEVIEHFRELPQPAIIPIPGISGNTGVGMRNVSLSVERAVGSDIIS